MAQVIPDTSFDLQVCNELKAAFADIFLRHPEVKALSCAVVWGGELNDATINHGVWVNNDGGGVQTAAGVLGSIHQTLRLLDVQFQRAEALRKQILAELQTAATEVIRGKEEKQQS